MEDISKTFYIKLFENDDRWMPKKVHESDAGYDLKAREFKGNEDKDNVTILPGCGVLIKTGVFIELCPGWEAQIRPRSGLALKQQLTVTNSPGTVDAMYRGEIGVIIHNIGLNPVNLKTEDRIAQMVIKQVPFVSLVKVVQINDTDRGECGFGSSGS